MGRFNILMIGPPRTGKSSLLASMIFNFDMVCSNYGLTLTADKDTKDIMDIRLESMEETIKNHCNNMEKSFPIDKNKTPSQDEYNFLLSANGSSNTHVLQFTDINGEKLFEDLEREDLKDTIHKSQIIMIAIDTPHLMEENGAYNTAFNRPGDVERLLNDFSEQEPMKLIMFVPIKCEKYYYENRMDEVNQRVKGAYAGLLQEYRENKTVNKKYTVAITPVLTAGGIVFDDFERDEEGFVKRVQAASNISLRLRPKTALYKINREDPYFFPRFCEQPVLYLLNFVATTDKLSAGRVEKSQDDMSTYLGRLIVRAVIAAVRTLFAFLFGGIEDIRKLWSDVLKDRRFVERAVNVKDKIKKDGDGYEIVQNPFDW